MASLRQLHLGCFGIKGSPIAQGVKPLRVRHACATPALRVSPAGARAFVQREAAPCLHPSPACVLLSHGSIWSAEADCLPRLPSGAKQGQLGAFGLFSAPMTAAEAAALHAATAAGGLLVPPASAMSDRKTSGIFGTAGVAIPVGRSPSIFMNCPPVADS